MVTCIQVLVLARLHSLWKSLVLVIGYCSLHCGLRSGQEEMAAFATNEKVGGRMMDEPKCFSGMDPGLSSTVGGQPLVQIQWWHWHPGIGTTGQYHVLHYSER